MTCTFDKYASCTPSPVATGLSRIPRRWYLVHCKTSQDARAELNLMAQGYDCFRPLHQRPCVLRGQPCSTMQSVFPGYLFIKLGLEDDWGPLRSTRGVLRLVGFGGGPLAVADMLISQLRERYPDDAGVEYSSGEGGGISDGPSSAIKAIFQAVDDDSRVMLLISYLQSRHRRVEAEPRREKD